MSNSVSLYVSDVDEMIDALRSIDWESDDELLPSQEDLLKNFNTDSYFWVLSELYEKAGDDFKSSGDARWLKLVLWSWLDGERTCGIPEDVADELFLDLAVTPDQLSAMSDTVEALSAQRQSEALFRENDLWESAEELASYLEVWIGAFQQALKERKGLFYKIWV